MSEIIKSDGSKAAEPEVVWSPSSTSSAKVKALVPDGEVYEFDPDKRYVIVVRQEVLPMNEVQAFCRMLGRMGVKAAVMSYRGGPIKDGIQVMDQENGK